MAQRRGRAASRVWLVAVAVLAFAAVPAVGAPPPVVAGDPCPVDHTCGQMYLIGTGNGAGTVTGTVNGMGINCAVDGNSVYGGCSVEPAFQGSLLIELTITAAQYSRFVSSEGDIIPAGQPHKEYVLLTADNPYVGKEVLFRLAGQEIELSIAGTGVIYHTETGVKCPPQCTLQYPYGEPGIHVAASPIDDTSTFTKWDGPCAGQGPICEFTMPKSTTMTATFGLKPAQTATPRPATPRPATTRPPTPIPTLVASPGVTSATVNSPEPEITPAASVVSASAVPSSAAIATLAPSVAPTSPVSFDPGFGSGLLIGLVVAGAVLAVGGFVLWRRRAPAG